MDGITFIDPRGDGRYLLTNSKDQSIKLWDVRAFSSKEAEVNTRKAVANQDWDYRWHTHVPKQRNLFLINNLLKFRSKSWFLLKIQSSVIMLAICYLGRFSV